LHETKLAARFPQDLDTCNTWSTGLCVVQAETMIAVTESFVRRGDIGEFVAFDMLVYVMSSI
jgi:hypothetical protein